MSASGLRFYFEDGSAERVPAAFERARQVIITALRSGMREAMDELAQYIVASKLSGQVLQRRSGSLAEAVEASVRVKVTDDAIIGSINPKPKRMPNEGLWEEFGTHHAAIAHELHVFAAPGGQIVFTEDIKAFDIAPRPFMNPSLHEQEQQIANTIREKLRTAVLE